jgi:hypothetical protein
MPPAARAASHLLEREVERPARSEEAARRLRLLDRAVLVQRRREGIEAGEIGLRVLDGCDGVGGVEEVRDREIGAALLEDAVGPNRAVDVEALRRDRLTGQRIAHDLQVELRRRRQGLRIEAGEHRQRLLDLRQLPRALGRRTVGEAALQAGIGAAVEAERARQLGAARDGTLEYGLERRVEFRVARAGLRKQPARQEGVTAGDARAGGKEGATVHRFSLLHRHIAIRPATAAPTPPGALVTLSGRKSLSRAGFRSIIRASGRRRSLSSS